MPYKFALGAAYVRITKENYTEPEIIYKMCLKSLKLPLQYELTHLQYAVHFAKRS